MWEKEYSKNWKKKNKCACLWHDINKRCYNSKSQNYKYYGGKGIKNFLSIDDVKFLWERDKANLMKKPSIDRQDNKEHYTIDNCQFVELSRNAGKEQRKIIFQFDKQGNFIKEWESAREIERELKIPNSNISACCLGKIKSARNYIWKFKKED